MNTSTVLLSLAVALLAGLLFSRLVKKVNLPAVTAYLVAGIIVGPFLLGALEFDFFGSELRYLGFSPADFGLVGSEKNSALDDIFEFLCVLKEHVDFCGVNVSTEAIPRNLRERCEGFVILSAIDVCFKRHHQNTPYSEVVASLDGRHSRYAVKLVADGTVVMVSLLMSPKPESVAQFHNTHLFSKSFNS